MLTVQKLHREGVTLLEGPYPADPDVLDSVRHREAVKQVLALTVN
jgi:hypothetical protein